MSCLEVVHLAHLFVVVAGTSVCDVIVVTDVVSDPLAVRGLDGTPAGGRDASAAAALSARSPWPAWRTETRPVEDVPGTEDADTPRPAGAASAPLAPAGTCRTAPVLVGLHGRTPSGSGAAHARTHEQREQGDALLTAVAPVSVYVDDATVVGVRVWSSAARLTGAVLAPFDGPALGTLVRDRAMWVAMHRPWSRWRYL